MFDKRFYYIVSIQYLGYRFHGWQKQPNLKTVHLMVDRTLNYILEGKRFKTLVSGRTDAMVSANSSVFELFLYHEIKDFKFFIDLFNLNLPQDIRALEMREVDAEFNIIQHSKIKEYIYLFAHGQKCHPFCAPIMTTFLEQLNIEDMKTGAKLFEGQHNFKSYCFRATEKGLYNREIMHCEISENTFYTANFFPKESYALIIRGKGFGRNQIRLMMGALVNLGRGDVDLTYIKQSLTSESKEAIQFVAPASGLILNKLEFN